MDRKTLKQPFGLDRTLDWTCPTCGKGVLAIKSGTFFKEEIVSSRDHSNDSWEPEWTRYVYSCLLECTNKHCKEIVSNIGEGSLVSDMFQDQDGEWIEEYHDSLRPKFFEPHLILLLIPASCPNTVSTPLHESFKLFFTAPSAAANCVRIAIEEVLTDLKVKRFNVINGQRRFISLHARITLLPAKFAQLKEHFFAIKWLGNAGSHGNNSDGGINMDDVMDAYEFTQHILDEVYTSKSKNLTARARKVNKKKGPVR